MTKVKVFRVEGEYTKDHQKYVFRKEKRALTKEAAIELVLSEISSIGLYRRQIRNISAKELKNRKIEEELQKKYAEEKLDRNAQSTIQANNYNCSVKMAKFQIKKESTIKQVICENCGKTFKTNGNTVLCFECQK